MGVFIKRSVLLLDSFMVCENFIHTLQEATPEVLARSAPRAPLDL